MGNRTNLLLAGIICVISIACGTTMDSPKVQVQAEEVLAKIEELNLPVEFENCIILGDLNLNSKVVYKPLHFNNSIFLGSIYSNSTNFKYPVYFEESDFSSNVYFIASNFNSTVDFALANFNSHTDFSMTKFSGNTDFSGSNFCSPVVFKGSKFNGETLFMLSIFNNDSDFRSSLFSGFADFRLSHFKSSADFYGSKFEKKAFFYDAEFNGSTSFSNGEFNDDANFEEVVFWGNLSLTKTRYDKLFVRWHNIKSGLIYDDSAYMLLLQNFKRLGYFEDYDSCYFQYRKEHRGQPWPLVSGLDLLIRKGIDIFLEWFYGYGTKPLNAIYFSIAIVIVFGIFWGAIGLGGLNDVTGEIDKDWEKPDSIYDILSFSTTIFLSGTRLFIDPPAIPKIKGRSKSLVKNAFTFERILGALFSILFIMAIGGTTIR
jgi:hypothetical protein